MKNVNRYKVYDAYDCYISGEWYGKPDLIGTGNARTEIEQIIHERDEDTDGECYIVIIDRYTLEEVNIEQIK